MPPESPEPASVDPHAVVRAALASARRALLDLTFRNHFLHHRVLRARGASIVGDDAERVARLLLDDDVALTFVTRAAAERTRAMRVEATPPADGGTAPDPSALPLRHAVDDRALVADHEPAELDRRLDATRKTAATLVEERGVNTLFVALGALRWREADASQVDRVAPLFLVPVTLERANVAHGVRLRYDGEDPQGNPTLQERLRQDGIDLPLPDDHAQLGAYLDRVERAVAGREGWRVERDHVTLGFYSFTRYLMYVDLDEGRWPDESALLEHPVVGAALARGFRAEPPPFDADERLDAQPAYAALQHVLEADASQSEAIAAALERTALVVQGPPGTGKSQTIANLLAEALARGQRVLFVAEKKAALDVVKRRLDAVGLGDAALELHSYRATRAAVVEALRRTTLLGRPHGVDAAGERERLERRRAELNDYVDALHAPIGATGLTPYRLIGRLAAAAGAGSPDDLDADALDLEAAGVDPTSERTPDASARLLAVADVLDAWAAEEGEPSEHPLRHARVEQATPAQVRALEEGVADAIAALVALDAALAALSGAPFEAPPATLDAAEGQLAAGRALAALQAAGTPVDTAAGVWRIGRTALLETAEAAHAAATLRAAAPWVALGAWRDVGVDADRLAAVRHDLTRRSDVLYRWFAPAFRRARATVRAWSTPGAPDDDATAIDTLDRLAAHVEHAGRFEAGAAPWRAAFPGHGDVVDAGAEVDAALAFVRGVERAGGGLHPDGATVLASLERSDVEARWTAAERALAQVRRALAELTRALAYDVAAEAGLMPGTHDEAARRRVRDLHGVALERLRTRLKAWRREPRRLVAAARWRRLRHDAAEAGAEPLWHALHAGRVRAQGLGARLRRALDQAWLAEAVAARPALARFDRTSHEAALAEFRALDAAQLETHRALVAAAHHDGLPPMHGHGEVGVLLQEFNKRRRHRPVRRLMEEAGNAVQALKPIFLMSPLSVATFLPPGGIAFDLVVFDEASQVRPADALGALLRGRRAVVVGDDRQLPPTSFFDALLEDVHPDDDTMVGDVESVLGLFGARGAPQTWLAWHYRSRHESLVAVSNREFYDGRLMLFPSPDVARADAGVVLHHLPDSVYDRGRSRTNAVEARAVAEAVQAHAHHRPERSLGVATFSLPQADAIDREVERLAGDDPVLQAFVQAHPLEPFFVKPLETVQGDERDEILVSVGYGRDAEGRLTYQFGPLNQVGGERRLNVLVTRARWRTSVYTNVTDEDLDPERCTSFGLRVLRTYLRYARTGELLGLDVGGRDDESPFEDAVADALRRRGYTVHRQVGQVGYHIDLALADPERPGRMLLGIECDGARYHASRAARDRDRLRQGVLEGLGWRIHRVWSSDWWHDPDGCLARIEDAFRDALAAAHAADAGAPAMGVPTADATTAGAPAAAASTTNPAGIGVAREAERLWDDAALAFEPYRVAALPPIRYDGGSLARAPTEEVAGWLERVVASEGAVHVEDAFRRVLDASAAARMGSRIRERLEQGLAAGVRSGRFARVGDALVPSSFDVATFAPRDRSALDARDRDGARVPAFELDAAVMQVVRASHGIEREQVASACARLLGFGRAGDALAAALDASVDRLVADGALIVGRRGELRAGPR